MQPFDEIIPRLERDILPVMQNWSKELERDFTSIQVKLNTTRSDNPSPFDKYFYSIYITCSKKGATKFPEFGDLVLSVDLKQRDDTSHPKLSAEVGMLVDEESEGDWGFNPIAKPFANDQEVTEDVFQILEKTLPHLYNSLRTFLEKTGIEQ